jgi:hypothetical protein
VIDILCDVKPGLSSFKITHYLGKDDTFLYQDRGTRFLFTPRALPVNNSSLLSLLDYGKTNLPLLTKACPCPLFRLSLHLTPLSTLLPSTRAPPLLFSPYTQLLAQNQTFFFPWFFREPPLSTLLPRLLPASRARSPLCGSGSPDLRATAPGYHTGGRLRTLSLTALGQVNVGERNRQKSDRRARVTTCSNGPSRGAHMSLIKSQQRPWNLELGLERKRYVAGLWHCGFSLWGGCATRGAVPIYLFFFFFLKGRFVCPKGPWPTLGAITLAVMVHRENSFRVRLTGARTQRKLSMLSRRRKSQ